MRYSNLVILKVSVIGISNWRLDNSKSIRALMVQRPQLSEKDSVETTLSLFFERESSIDMNKRNIQNLARAYTNYQKNQKYPNFHGIYCLVR